MNYQGCENILDLATEKHAVFSYFIPTTDIKLIKNGD
tara:strand:+ start:199 stop:309 length:111 start_codon:yes stop_codon:yes gene_type:complete